MFSTFISNHTYNLFYGFHVLASRVYFCMASTQGGSHDFSRHVEIYEEDDSGKGKKIIIDYSSNKQT